MKIWELEHRSTEWLLNEKIRLETLPIEKAYFRMSEYWLQILNELKSRIKTK